MIEATRKKGGGSKGKKPLPHISSTYGWNKSSGEWDPAGAKDGGFWFREKNGTPSNLVSTLRRRDIKQTGIQKPNTTEFWILGTGWGGNNHCGKGEKK